MSEAGEIADLLGQTDFFARLDPPTLNACAAQFRERRFTQGQSLFARGDLGDQLLLIVEGRVRLAVTSDEGRDLSVRHAVRGDLLGEIAVLDGGKRSADGVALTPVVASILRKPQLEALMSAHPAIASGALVYLCRKLRQTTDQLENIALHSIEVRLARFLLNALDGRKAAPGKRVPVETHVSQSELAQLLGASRPKVNVALGVLEQAGAIRRTSDRVFCDPDILAKFASLTHA